MKNLDDLLSAGVAGRRVLVRADLNVPLDGETITDDGRVQAVLPNEAMYGFTPDAGLPKDFRYAREQRSGTPLAAGRGTGSDPQRAAS